MFQFKKWHKISIKLEIKENFLSVVANDGMYENLRTLKGACIEYFQFEVIFQHPNFAKSFDGGGHS